MDLRKPKHRALTITPEVGGFLVECGCWRKVYSQDQTEAMIEDFKDYMRNPEGIEREWMESQKKQPTLGGGQGARAEIDTERRP